MDEWSRYIAKQFGSTVRSRRQAAGMTLKDLAGRAGMAASYLSLVERGKTNPSLNKMVGLVRELGGRSLEEFFGEAQLTLTHATTLLLEEGVTTAGIVEDD